MTVPAATPRQPVFAMSPRTRLPEEIANRILSLIQTRQLRPGDRLPPERELAQTMGVSRPVLREALQALSLMRVVDIRQGDGTYITALEPQQLVSHLDFAFALDGVAFDKLFEARRVVETGNARFAAGRVTADEIARLEGLLVALGAALDDPVRFSTLDMEFHDAICGAADNFLLSQFMRIIDTMGRVSRQRTGAKRSVRETARRDHADILEALRAGDAGAAEVAMREHLDHVEVALRAQVAGSADARDDLGAPLDAIDARPLGDAAARERATTAGAGR
jgi:GntR family transcriptional repressor for pyruvate dehydrogenase complex